MMHRNKSVDVHQFAMVPRADIPRAAFDMQHTLKTTLDSGFVVPIYCEEVLPGDSFNLDMTAFARLATPIFPVMDNLYLDSFFFFVPNRLVWDNWQRFMGQQANPTDSISFVVPQCTMPNGGYPIGSIFDHFGLPTIGQVTAGFSVPHSALPLRAYNLIYNEWFRDQNLQDSSAVPKGDGPDLSTNYSLQRRGKRHDYFTSALPWPQKGGVPVTIPLGTSAPVLSNGQTFSMRGAAGALSVVNTTGAANGPMTTATATGVGAMSFGPAGTPTTGLYADLSLATGATINQLRQSFQIQKLLERDARGGTRYTEIVRSHFGVVSPDARLDRPEYLGGGSTPILFNPVPQTSGTGASGTTAPLGNLGAMAAGVTRRHGFSQSFSEHGYVIGLVSVRADLSYQQGLRKHWSRSTRYDFYFPAFAALGEQAVLGKEIYADGTAGDNGIFGYQERWAEYRFAQSSVTGRFRSTAASTLDPWHLSQRFASRPQLNAGFIAEDPPVSRVLAVPAAATSAQFIMDVFFKNRAVRPMPLYSVPGLIDHF